jgi:hypothetical protein
MRRRTHTYPTLNKLSNRRASVRSFFRLTSSEIARGEAFWIYACKKISAIRAKGITGVDFIGRRAEGLSSRGECHLKRSVKTRNMIGV